MGPFACTGKPCRTKPQFPLVCFSVLAVSSRKECLRCFVGDDHTLPALAMVSPMVSRESRTVPSSYAMHWEALCGRLPYSCVVARVRFGPWRHILKLQTGND